MEIINLQIPDVKIIIPQVFSDPRGSFQESYSQKRFSANSLNFDFIQDNYSITSNKGTVRGLHFQTEPMTQTKLIKVTRGTIFDVVVDLRKNSPTFKKHLIIELNSSNHKQLLIPKGCAHGFCSLSDDCHILYKVDNFYSPAHNAGIIWNGLTLNIPWPSKSPLLSEQDQLWPTFENGYTF